MNICEFLNSISQGEFSETENEENFEYYNLEYSFKCFNSSFNLNDVIKLFNKVSSRDDCSISISLDGTDPIPLNSSEPPEASHFIDQLNSLSKLVEEESEFRLKVVINKKIVDNKLSFYSFSNFEKMLLNDNFAVLVKDLSGYISIYSNIHLILLDDLITEDLLMYTSTISITNNEENLPDLQKLSRQKIIQNGQEACNRMGEELGEILPDDFYPIKYHGTHLKDIHDQFCGLCYLVCILFIFDTVIINSKNINFKLNGYKPKTGILCLKKMKKEYVDDLYSTYSWVYSDSIINDKLGLSRNILSLNLTEENDYTIVNIGAFASIKSGYEIYLKENVNQYIEIKNKVSEFMINKSIESSNLVRDYISSLKYNNYLFVTFFISFIVLKALNNESEIFTREIVLISLGVLSVSLLYLIFNTIFIEGDIKRFQDQYSKLKRLYSDLLTDTDISNIFLDKEHEDDIEYIRKKKKQYFRVWLIEIIILILVVLIIGHFNKVLF